MPPKKKKAAAKKAATKKRKAPTPKKSPKGGAKKKKVQTPATPAEPPASERKLIDEGEIGSRYAEPDGKSCGIDGIIALAEDLEVEVEDPVLLVLAHEMGAAAQGVFTRDEWLQGFTSIVRLNRAPSSSRTSSCRAPTSSAV